jgi:hypothetical protein
MNSKNLGDLPFINLGKWGFSVVLTVSEKKNINMLTLYAFISWILYKYCR